MSLNPYSGYFSHHKQKTYGLPTINGCLTKYHGEGNGTPLQYSCLENPMDKEEPGRLQSMGELSWTRLSDFTFTFHLPALEKEMATHSSVLAWRIPGTTEPGRLPSMGSHRVGHDWSDRAAAAATKYQNEENIVQMAPCSFTWLLTIIL